MPRAPRQLTGAAGQPVWLRRGHPPAEAQLTCWQWIMLHLSLCRHCGVGLPAEPAPLVAQRSHSMRILAWQASLLEDLDLG